MEIPQAWRHSSNVRARERKQAGQVDRALQVEPMIEQLGKQVRMAHRLILAAHDAEWHEDAAILGGHAGDDGVHRALSRSDLVPMRRREDEALSPVVEEHA